MYICRIDFYSHHFVVKAFRPRIREVAESFCERLIHYRYGYIPKTRQRTRTPMKVYAAFNSERMAFRLHIHQWEEFKRHMLYKGIMLEHCEMVTHTPLVGVDADFYFVSGKVPYDYQLPMIDYLNGQGKTKVINTQTGSGKTLVTLKSMQDHGVRTAIVILGKYVDRWLEALEEEFGLTKDDVLVIRGSAKLKKAIAAGISGKLTESVIIITATTLQRYFKAYENGVGHVYGCDPVELYPTLGVGLKVVDEAHDSQHLVFKMDLYTHVAKTIYLSATIEHDDNFKNKMLRVIFPPEIRFKGIPVKRYIGVEAIYYSSDTPIRCVDYNGRYSHVMFEESIMKRPWILRQYLNMIDTLVDDQFVGCRDHGQKALIFASTKKLCTIIAEHLQNNNPHLTVNRYIGEDDYSQLINGDICVSTLLSSGTAVDIPGLRYVLLTTAIDSSQSNLQAVGRLRELKQWPEVTPLFMYLVCREIPKHIKYHEHKRQLLAYRVKYHKTLESPFRLKT